MAKLTIHTFIGHNSALYAENLRSHCEALKSGFNTIEYKCYRTIGHAQYKENERIPIGWWHVADIEAHPLSSSYSHAKGIHRALDYIKSNPGIHIIIDVDTCITYQDWDLIIVNKLQDIELLGWNNKKCLPSVMFLAFHSNLLDYVNFDFTPKLIPKRETCYKMPVRTPDIAHIYNLNIGESIKCDTAWRIPEILHKACVKYECLNRILGVQQESILPFKNKKQKKFCFKGDKDEHMCEWHYEKKLFGTHMQASRSFAFDSPRGNVWKERIDMYMNKEYGYSIK